MKKLLGIVVLGSFAIIQTNLSLADAVCNPIDSADPNSEIICKDNFKWKSNSKSGGQVPESKSKLGDRVPEIEKPKERKIQIKISEEF